MDFLNFVLSKLQRHYWNQINDTTIILEEINKTTQNFPTPVEERRMEKLISFKSDTQQCLSIRNSKF